MTVNRNFAFVAAWFLLAFLAQQFANRLQPPFLGALVGFGIFLGIGLCALTTIASCGSLITTHYRGLASIGAVLCFGAAFCLASTLLLLPALLAPSEKAGSQP